MRQLGMLTYETLDAKENFYGDNLVAAVDESGPLLGPVIEVAPEEYLRALWEERNTFQFLAYKYLYLREGVLARKFLRLSGKIRARIAELEQ